MSWIEAGLTEEQYIKCLLSPYSAGVHSDETALTRGWVVASCLMRAARVTRQIISDEKEFSLSSHLGEKDQECVNLSALWFARSLCAGTGSSQGTLARQSQVCWPHLVFTSQSSAKLLEKRSSVSKDRFGPSSFSNSHFVTNNSWATLH